MVVKFTKAINIYENKVYGLINAEYNYQKKLLKAKPKVTIEDYEKTDLKASIAIEKVKLILAAAWFKLQYKQVLDFRFET